MKSKMRNSSIELLRIIAMIGVVILHYNNSKMGGGFKYVNDGSAQQKYLFFSESLFICAVNLFVMISGYFLSTTEKRKFIKVVELLSQVILFRVFFYIVGLLFGGEQLSFHGIVNCILPANYFVIFYLIVYILSPYINIMIKNISKKQFKILVTVLFLLFAVWTFFADIIDNVFGIGRLNTVGLYGDQEGYTIVNFVLIYFIGAYIRLNNISITRTKSTICIIACVALIYFEKIIGETFYGTSLAWNYCNPIVVILPVFIILLFTKLEINNKIINELAKAAFTCYLLHGQFLKKLGVERFVNGNIFILILHQLSSAIVLYLISYVIYKVYHFITNPIIKCTTSKINKIDISL